MEVGETVSSLDFVDSQFHFSERVVLVLLEIGERDFKYPALE